MEAANGYSRKNLRSVSKCRLLAAFPLLSFSLHYESCRCLGLAMKDRELEKMKLDDLWDLHQRIIDVLDRKLETEKRKLQDQLDELGRKFGGSPKDIPQRRPYPKVEPKFRNPNDPSETWSGRGKTPRWMIEMIADGRSIDDFRIQ
jgi:DNA-binding protein H-NS